MRKNQDAFRLDGQFGEQLLKNNISQRLVENTSSTLLTVSNLNKLDQDNKKTNHRYVSDVLNRNSFDRMLLFDTMLTLETYRPVHEIIMESTSEREAGSSTSRVNSKPSTPSNGYRSIGYEEPTESSGRTQGFGLAND